MNVDDIEKADLQLLVDKYYQKMVDERELTCLENIISGVDISFAAPAQEPCYAISATIDLGRIPVFEKDLIDRGEVSATRKAAERLRSAITMATCAYFENHI